MSNSALIGELRKKAIEKLQESTQMFERASVLRKAGNVAEAQRLRESARTKRLESSRLMAEASRLERGSATDQASAATRQ